MSLLKQNNSLRLVPPTGSWKSPREILLLSLEGLSKRMATDDWARRHLMAWEFSSVTKSTGKMKLEAAVRDAILSWCSMGEAHRVVHGSNIGEDAILGAAWKGQAQCLLIMLNGELGRLDGGTLDKIIRDVAETCGVNLEE